MNSSKIGTYEAIMLVLSLVVSHTVLSLPKAIVTTTKSSSILNLIYLSIFVFVFVIIICNIFKKFPGMDILDLAEYLGGKIFKRFLGIIFILYFTISSAIFLRNFCECLQIVYYPSTSIVFIVLSFIISTCLVADLPSNASFKANLIIVPFVLGSILFLFLANLKYFNYNRIFPILGNGLFETFGSGFTNIYAFSGIALIYFLPPLLKHPEKLKKISIIAFILTALYLVFVIALILLMFPIFTNIDEVLPLYTVATYVEFGTFLQRLESVFLLIWMISFSCYLSIILSFVFLFFKKITDIKYNKPMIYPFGMLLLALSLLPKTFAESKFYETNIYPYVLIAVAYFIPGIIMFFAYIKKKKEGDINEYTN